MTQRGLLYIVKLEICLCTFSQEKAKLKLVLLIETVTVPGSVEISPRMSTTPQEMYSLSVMLPCNTYTMKNDRSWTLHGSFGKFYCNVSIIL